MRDPRREGREGQSASVRAPVRNMAPFRVATSGDIVAMAISTRLGLVGVVVALGALAAGCGGSGSTTASIAGTTVSATVPGTTATLPAASSVAQAATSAAAGAASSASSAAQDLKQRLGSSLPGLDSVIKDVQQADDGTVTVHTSLSSGDALARIATNGCQTARQAAGSSATHLVILAADGSTIASC